MDYWLQMGKKEIQDSLDIISKVENGTVAKNVIIFIGDGMSNPTLPAARIFKGQHILGNINHPETEYLTFERLPFMGHCKVGSS